MEVHLRVFLTLARSVAKVGDGTFQVNGLGVKEISLGGDEAILCPVLLITHEIDDAGTHDGAISLRNDDHKAVDAVSPTGLPQGGAMSMSIEIAPTAGALVWAAKTGVSGVHPGSYEVVLFLKGQFAASWPIRIRA